MSAPGPAAGALERVLDELEALLKDPRTAEALAPKAVNTSLALVAFDGLRAYLEGRHGAATEDLETAAEEIGARHRRASTEKPS